MVENLFNRKLLEQNQKRFAKDFSNHNFLYLEVANRIAENLSLMNREFRDVLEVGARGEYLKELVHKTRNEPPITTADANYNFHEDSEIIKASPESFDLIISNLNFHFINEIPQFLISVKNALKKDGIFIASFFGEENLRELAHVLYKSEMEIYNGVSPIMPPTIDVKTAAMILQKAGFSSPISDFEKIAVEYDQPIKLLQDLKFMGQGNILNNRTRRFFSKRFLNKILENYKNLYRNSDNSVNATFEIVTITGWKA